MKLIGRLIWVAIAFLLAGSAGVAVAAVIGAELITRNAAQLQGMAVDDAADKFFFQFDQLGKALPLLHGVTLLPAVGLVIAGEVLRIRSLLYYVAGGGLAAVAIPLAARLNAGFPADGVALATTALQTLAVGGFAAGAVYWLLAGRRA
jgi:hypothetical protein